MVAVYGLYHYVVELPGERAISREKLKAAAEEQGFRFDDATFDTFYKRVQDGHEYGPFAHPNSYAGYLALLLPGLAGVVVVCLRNRAPGNVTRLAATVLILSAAALWVSHSRG